MGDPREIVPPASPPPPVSSERKDYSNERRHELTGFEAYELAGRFNLPAGQVTQAWRLFKRYDSRGQSVITSPEFQLLLRSVLREHYPKARDIPRELFKRATNQEKDVSFSEFLVWITENSFS